MAAGERPTSAPTGRPPGQTGSLAGPNSPRQPTLVPAGPQVRSRESRPKANLRFFLGTMPRQKGNRDGPK